MGDGCAHNCTQAGDGRLASGWMGGWVGVDGEAFNVMERDQQVPCPGRGGGGIKAAGLLW